MVYTIVEEHANGVTLKEIAEAESINFSKGFGFYELVKKETVSAGKRLVLWSNGQLVSDVTEEILKRCGLRVNADNIIQPKDIPAGHKLFVQSTSPNRKISEDAAVLFLLDDAGNVKVEKRPIASKKRQPKRKKEEEEEEEEEEDDEEGDEEDDEEDEDAAPKKKPKTSSATPVARVIAAANRVIKMTHKLVSEHADGATLKEIADAADITFSQGFGFYELTKKEKVSAGKRLVLWSNGKIVSEVSDEILKRCGLRVNADNNIQPKDIPAGHKLFVQSTSPNRKISEDAVVLFLVEDDGKDEKENSGDYHDDADNSSPNEAKDSSAASYVKMKELIECLNSNDFEDAFEEPDHFTVNFGSMFKECDMKVPEIAQSKSLFQLSQLFRVEWDESTIQFENRARGDAVLKAYAKGTLTFYDDEFRSEIIPVEIVFNADVPLFAVTYGNMWGAMIGSIGEHPFVWCSEIVYDNSDGSSDQGDLKALPEGAGKIDRLNALFAYNIKWFLLHCGDANH